MNQINAVTNNENNAENIYLSKVLLFTESTINIAEKLKLQSESAVSTNCLNTIGMYPIISRIKTTIGLLCLSIWIISSEERFNQFRSAYYSGASHTIILCTTQKEFSNFSNLFLLAPKGIPTTIASIGKNYFSSFDQNKPREITNDEFNRLISFRTLTSFENLELLFNDIGQRIANEILSGEYQTFTPQQVRPSNIYKLYNKHSFNKVQSFVKKIGYVLDKNGIVTIPKQDFTYQIDFYRNQVKATITDCYYCKHECKYYRKLCILEETQGYSNSVYYDNLRALAILYSIHEDNFIKLTGEKSREDVAAQLQRVKILFEGNCQNNKNELFTNHHQSNKTQNKNSGQNQPL